MSERTITLHTFASVKGGVGKSTLAITCAKLLARRGRVPVVIDCDLTGTSFADGFRLRAPDIATGAGGLIDLTAAPVVHTYLSVEETRERRARRGSDLRIESSKGAAGARVLPPPYFNDVLKAVDLTEGPVQVQAALWRHEDEEDTVLYLPSSSLQRDTAESLRWYDERAALDWAQCVFWAIEVLTNQRPDLTDVVLDLPPGTWGLSHEAMVFVSLIDQGKPFPDRFPPWGKGPTRWRANPFLVTSADGNDLLPALEYVGRYQRKHLPSLRPLANRVTEGVDVVQGRVRDLLGPAFAAVEIEKMLTPVPEVGALARIFKEGTVRPDEEVLALASALRVEGSDERQR